MNKLYICFKITDAQNYFKDIVKNFLSYRKLKDFINSADG